MKRDCVSIALFFVVFIFSVIISSCSDGGIEPESAKINISGKISALFNIPVSNVVVKVNEKVTTTSAYGDFSLKDVTIPYDLIIIDSINKAGYIYKGLSRTNLDIFLSYITQSYGTANIHITYPANLPDLEGKAIFIDGNQRSFYSSSSTLSSIPVYMENNTSLNGKVIMIFYTIDSFNGITSYEKYGEKNNITVTAGGNTNVDFTLDDLKLNPGEVTVSGSFSGLQGLNSLKFFYLSFEKRITSGFAYDLLFSIIQGNNFNLVLPTNLPSDYTPLIYIRSQGTYPNANITDQFVLPIGGTGINLNLPDYPSLVYPPDNAINIDTTTLFEWTSGTGNGIYCITFWDSAQSITYSIFTNSLNTTLSNLNSIGFGNISNRTFRWNCEKHGSVSSLDEYLDPERNNLGYYNATTSTRMCKTKR
jgi:hypothetical protein